MNNIFIRDEKRLIDKIITKRANALWKRLIGSINTFKKGGIIEIKYSAKFNNKWICSNCFNETENYSILCKSCNLQETIIHLLLARIRIKDYEDILIKKVGDEIKTDKSPEQIEKILRLMGYNEYSDFILEVGIRCSFDIPKKYRIFYFEYIDVKRRYR